MGKTEPKLTMAYYYDKEHNKVKTAECNRSILKGDLIRSTGIDDSEAERISCLVFDELSKLDLKYVTPRLIREFVGAYLLSTQKHDYFLRWLLFFTRRRPPVGAQIVKCEFCGKSNKYGETKCKQCGAPL
jgi:2-phosphoglycerate kinase